MCQNKAPVPVGISAIGTSEQSHVLSEVAKAGCFFSVDSHRTTAMYRSNAEFCDSMAENGCRKKHPTKMYKKQARAAMSPHGQ
jgi:hypothetical protein